MFSIFKKNSEAEPEEFVTDNIDPNDWYLVTMYDGKTHKVPGAWVKSDDDDTVEYKGKYYYIDWEQVEAIVPI